MKVKVIKGNRSTWTVEQHRAVLDAYNEMLRMQAAGEKFVKAQVCRDLIESTGKTRGAIECTFMNISGFYQDMLSMPIVKGYKALSNGSHQVAQMICDDLGIDYDRTV